MEIRRIGTDIQLYVNLKTRVKEPLNIHSVQAFLVNTSLRDELMNNDDNSENDSTQSREFQISGDCDVVTCAIKKGLRALVGWKPEP